MTKETSIKLFESNKIRVHWDNDLEKWFFSIIDIIETLTGSNNPRRYWSDLKRKLIKEGFSQLYEIIVQLKLESADGKNANILSPLISYLPNDSKIEPYFLIKP